MYGARACLASLGYRAMRFFEDEILRPCQRFVPEKEITGAVLPWKLDSRLVFTLDEEFRNRKIGKKKSVRSSLRPISENRPYLRQIPPPPAVE